MKSAGMFEEKNDVYDEFPIKLSSAKAWRTYRGGKLLAELHGECASDSNYPEEWIASCVCARNTDREDAREEGLSKLADAPEISLKEVIEKNPERLLGEEHAKQFGTSMGVLVKLIDSSERLTIQVHPDRDKARVLFHSSYGKTECWHIIGGRNIRGESPCIYLGFQEWITKDRWKELFEKQDINGMLSCLHKFEVHSGDTVYIEGGVPHAIGAGCFLVEIQEPTDYTLRVERITESGLPVSEFMCHQGIGFKKMLDCFQYEGLNRKEAEHRWFVNREIVECQEGGTLHALIGAKQTGLFHLEILEIETEFQVKKPLIFTGMYVLEGKGIVSTSKKKETIKQGEQFFIPAIIPEFLVRNQSDKLLRILLFGGPNIMRG